MLKSSRRKFTITIIQPAFTLNQMKAFTIEEKLREGLHGYTMRAIERWKSIRALARGVYIYGSSYSSIKNYVDVIMTLSLEAFRS